MARPLQPSPDAQATVLGVVQRAQERLPERDASLADRLFVLECAARGGRAVLPTVERYRPALREAEWWLDETWEPDVPHAAVVGKALSAANALEVDPPSNWPDLLGEAITALERRRQGRFGIGGDPSLLAVVLRGLDAAHMRAPEWLLTDAADVLNQRRSSEATAELADALARHRSGQPLVANAVAAAFQADKWTDADAPYARWWLASRRKEVDHQLSARAIDDARLQALAVADPLNGKAAAMVLEAAARASGELIITSAATLSADRSRKDRRMQAELAGYRGAFLSMIWVAGLIFVHRLAHAAASVVSATSAHPYRQTIVGVLIALLVFTVAESCGAIAKAYGRDQPRWATGIEFAGATAAGIIAATVS
jgi:hypothetical protein